MARIVVVTSGLAGLFNACLALMQQLQKAGHQIIYASSSLDSDRLREPLLALGIAYVQLEPWTMPVETESGGWWKKMRRLRVRQQKAVDALRMDRFAQTMRAIAPDLLLVDIEMHPHIMTAVMCKIPTALLCPFISIWRDSCLPPIHTDIVPGEGWRGQRWGILWSWLRYSWRKWKGYQRDRLKTAGLDSFSVLRRYAKQIGYSWHNYFGFNHWLVPYPHQNIPILCLHSQAIDFPHTPCSSIQHLGPMVLKNRRCIEESETLRTLGDFLSKRQGDALIYCGCSSFAPADYRFLRRLIAIAHHHPEWDFVIGMGNRGCSEWAELMSVKSEQPANVCALAWAPQRLVLQQADCAIINAGAHSITECIYFGVPMLVYSRHDNDQDGNAARVAYYGLGIAGEQKQDDEARIYGYIKQLLTQITYRGRIDQMREKFHHDIADRVAIRAVEALLAAPLSVSSKGRQEVAL